MDGDRTARAKILLSEPSNSKLQSLLLDAIEAIFHHLVIFGELINGLESRTKARPIKTKLWKLNRSL